MGYVEIFRMNEDGAGWADLKDTTLDERLDLELALEIAGSPVTRLILETKGSSER